MGRQVSWRPAWSSSTGSVPTLTVEEPSSAPSDIRVVSLNLVWFGYPQRMLVAPCISRDNPGCPVAAWQDRGFAPDERDRSRVRKHGSTKGGGVRFRCVACRKTFSLDRWRALEARRQEKFGTYREQLMFEVLWSVRCEGVAISLASRRVGVDWATGRRWMQLLEARMSRTGQLADLCSPHNASKVRTYRTDRFLSYGPSGFASPTLSDWRWYHSALAGEVLFRARDADVIGAAKYRLLLKRLTNRRYAGSHAWKAEMDALDR
jgi:hypothetical protein